MIHILRVFPLHMYQNVLWNFYFLFATKNNEKNLSTDVTEGSATLLHVDVNVRSDLNIALKVILKLNLANVTLSSWSE